MGVSRAELYTAIRRDKRLDPEVSQRTLGEKYGLDRRDAAGGPGHAAQAEAHRPQIRPRSTWSTSWPRPRMRRSSRGPSPAMGASISSALDEFGYLDLDKAGAKLLFQIFTEREERRAIAIASNAPFSEWKRTFTDPGSAHRRDRHRVLPVHPDPAQAAPQMTLTSTLGKAVSTSLRLRPQVIARWENRVRDDRIWGLRTDHGRTACRRPLRSGER